MVMRFSRVICSSFGKFLMNILILSSHAILYGRPSNVANDTYTETFAFDAIFCYLDYVFAFHINDRLHCQPASQPASHATSQPVRWVVNVKLLKSHRTSCESQFATNILMIYYNVKHVIIIVAIKNGQWMAMARVRLMRINLFYRTKLKAVFFPYYAILWLGGA